MKLKKYDMVLLLLLGSTFGLSQEIALSVENELMTNTLETKETTNISAKAGAANIPKTAGSTPAQFSVTKTGAATYQIPFSLPPGIQSMTPNIGLTYNSQSGNGLPGWGWSISGLSSIRRIPATQYHDAQIDPVDFDSSDRYALDGQRLILKRGSYGASNSEYQTENYSNLKIVAYGTSSYGSSYGPSYFIVFYPDGSRAWYGRTEASTRLEWALFKKQDPQGNFIQYDYRLNGSILRIDAIKYGSNGYADALNEIKFHYKTRERQEFFYVGGIKFEDAYILDKVEVKGRNNLFRTYTLAHETSSLGYQKIVSITEKNEEGKTFSPVTFSYAATSDDVHKRTITAENASIYDAVTDGIFAGDFNGDGKTDAGIYEVGGKEFSVYSNLRDGNVNGVRITTTETVKQVFASRVLTNTYKVAAAQGITTVSDYTDTKIRLKTYSLTDNTYNSKYLTLPTYTSVDCSNGSTIHKPFRYVSGDFNGDGFTDVMALGKTYEYRTKHHTDFFRTCYSNLHNGENKNSYFIELKRTASNTSPYSGDLLVAIASDDKIKTGDFNGDGKTDIFHFKSGKVYIYSLNDEHQLEHLFTRNDSSINLDYPVLMGDYNGDGKTDFTIPTANDSYVWRFFISRGTDILATTTTTEVNYRSSFYISRYGVTISGRGYIFNPSYQYYFVAQDFNGDGKTDLMRYHTLLSKASSYSGEEIQLFSNTGNLTFREDFYKTLEGTGVEKEGVPLALDVELSNSNPEFVFLNSNKLHYYEFLKSHQQEMVLEHIQNNDMQTSISYQKLGIPESGKASIYEDDTSELYPYVNINIAPGFRLVKHIEKEGSGVIQKQDYQYGGAVSHKQGLGFQGFKIFKKTNWYGDGVGRLWNVSLHSPQLRGAVTTEWMATSSSGVPGNYFKRTDYSYDITLSANPASKAYSPENEPDHIERNGALHTSKTDIARSIRLKPGFLFTASNSASYQATVLTEETRHLLNNGQPGNAGVFSGKPTRVIREDRLRGVTTTQTIAYDFYNNIVNTVHSFPGGSNRKSYVYAHNAAANDKTYHIGRPTKITETNTLGSETFATEQQMTYNNNLVTVLKRKGDGTDWLTESFTYDTYGNLLSKTLSATGMASRTERFEYDASGRFLIKSTDIEGLETNHSYNTNNGNLLSTTTPHGLTTSYAYDGWGRVQSETDYLGNHTNYVYSVTTLNNEWALAKNISFAQGGQATEYYNAFGWLLKTKTSGLNQIDTYKSYTYDAIGRKTGESEPYRSGGSSQWNTFAYDLYGRLVSQTLFTGKVVNTSYNGLSVTVNDGVKSVVTTKDVPGNIREVSDPGGTIQYSYYANGSVKEANYGNYIVRTEIDGWGRKTKLNDPSAGTYSYSYNALGEILSETTPKGTTTYNYDNYGKLLTKTITGDATDLSLSYTYDPDSKLLLQMDGTDAIADKNYHYSYAYDAHQRPVLISEQTPTAYFKKELGYDAFGRVATEVYDTQHLASHTQSLLRIQNVYDPVGILYEIKDADTNASLWKLNTVNASGQATNVYLGNGMTKVRTYDAFGFLSQLSDTKEGTAALQMDYTFDRQQGNLTSRTNHAFANYTENFSYDAQDRLIGISGATNHTQSYDERGRITENSFVGDYQYNDSKIYQLAGIDLNTQGDLYYQQHAPQQISYNAFKKPVRIYKEAGGRVDFEYGPLQNRTYAYYGGSQTDKTQRHYHKHYSSILPVEMIEDTALGSVKIISYIGGDAYTAPIAHIKTAGGNNDTDAYHYLHRDYLGSILAISDNAGTVLEQRQFGAWGQVDRFEDSDGNTAFTHSALLGRGYTGHEHFFEVGLIHMNGRMYDSKLGRFLSPDNYIQDPFNTQSYNRYGYVWNNPLSNVDPDGEFIIPAIMIGLAAGIGAHTGNKIAESKGYDINDWQTWAYMLGGAVISGGAAMASVAVAGSGIPLANTAAIATGSAINSGGNYLLSGGETDFMISFGVVSYNFSESEWGYLGKKGNEWYENLGYAFGAMANLSDVVTLFRGDGQNIKVNSAKTTKDDWWGHSSITDENGNSLISVGPDSQVQKGMSLSETWNNSIKGADTGWNTYLGKKGTWSIELNNISTTAINKYATGVTRWDLLLNSCIGHTSRALWSAGVPNIYLFHPHFLNAQLLVRQLGIYSSPYLYKIP